MNIPLIQQHLRKLIIFQSSPKSSNKTHRFKFHPSTFLNLLNSFHNSFNPTSPLIATFSMHNFIFPTSPLAETSQTILKALKLVQYRVYCFKSKEKHISNFKLECHMFQIPNTMKYPAICSINFHCMHAQNVSWNFFKDTRRLETSLKKAIVL